MAYCRACGHLNSDTASFCRACGAPQDVQTERPSETNTVSKPSSGAPNNRGVSNRNRWLIGGGVALVAVVICTGLAIALRSKGAPSTSTKQQVNSASPDLNAIGQAAPYQVINGQTDSDGFPTTPARLCISSNEKQDCYTPPTQDPPFGLDAKAEVVKLASGSSLILFTAESSSGGSGSLTIITLLENQGGRLENLLPKVAVTNQSEYRVWTLPSITTMPILTTADYIWAAGETHFAHHLYRITSYVYDKNAGRYIQRDQFVSSKKYSGLDDADGVKVLEPEKETIVARLQHSYPSGSDSPPSTPIAVRPENDISPDPAIEQTLNQWAAALARNDVSAQVGFYATEVDPYFLMHAVSRQYIERDKQKLFDKGVRLTSFHIRDLIVSMISSNEATVLLTKDWQTREGAENARSTRSRLHLKRFDEGWKIVGEQDLRSQ